MEHGIRERRRAQRLETVALGELIHQHVRAAVEQAVQEELAALLGATSGVPGASATVTATSCAR